VVFAGLGTLCHFPTANDDIRDAKLRLPIASSALNFRNRLLPLSIDSSIFLQKITIDKLNSQLKILFPPQPLPTNL
jgi:hypothetical protein